MTTNIERVVHILMGEGMFDAEAHCYAQALADAGLLMPDLPEPKWPGFWEVDRLEINLVDKDGEVNLDWREGPYHGGEDRSLWLSRDQVLAILAAAKLGKEKAC